MWGQRRSGRHAGLNLLLRIESSMPICWLRIVFRAVRVMTDGPRPRAVTGGVGRATFEMLQPDWAGLPKRISLGVFKDQGLPAMRSHRGSLQRFVPLSSLVSERT